jgi:response regulator RpfG family c-di-GMP phosphodiesterase
MHNLEIAPEETVMTTTTTYPGAYMQSHHKAILCLCYDSNVLQVRRMVLERFGYKVFPSSSVEDAKTVAEDQCPDMLLMDNSYPEVDFEQVARQVKQICPETIAVVLSPYYYGARNGASGAIDRFLVRDDGPDALILQIEELFGEHGPSAASSAM